MSKSLNQAKDREGNSDVNKGECGRNEDNVDSEGDSAYAVKILEPVKVTQADRQEETANITPEKIVGMALE